MEDNSNKKTWKQQLKEDFEKESKSSWVVRLVTLALLIFRISGIIAD